MKEISIRLSNKKLMVDDKALELFGEFACLNFPLYGA